MGSICSCKTPAARLVPVPSLEVTAVPAKIVTVVVTATVTVTLQAGLKAVPVEVTPKAVAMTPATILTSLSDCII